MIYINGYWNRVGNLLGLSPGTPEESYWNFFSPSFISSSRAFMGAAADETDRFIDGSSIFGIDQYASDRYMFGFQYGIEHYDELVKELKSGESFKIVSHSEGGAFASGLADYLIIKGRSVERMLFLSPREADAFSSPDHSFAIQVHFNNDPVCIAKPISGVDIYINLRDLDGEKADLRYAHGGTVKESTINKVQQIMKLIPHDQNNQQIVKQWIITETDNGYTFNHDDGLTTENK
jgi:hypothetical protein